MFLIKTRNDYFRIYKSNYFENTVMIRFMPIEISHFKIFCESHDWD